MTESGSVSVWSLKCLHRFFNEHTDVFIFVFFPVSSYMVDAADPEKIEASKNELHNLLDKPQLQGIPVRTKQSESEQNKVRRKMTLTEPHDPN